MNYSGNIIATDNSVVKTPFKPNAYYTLLFITSKNQQTKEKTMSNKPRKTIIETLKIHIKETNKN